MTEAAAFDEDFIAAFRAEMMRPASHRTESFELREMQSRSSRDGARGRFFVTPHAVRRYIERYRRGASYETALDELILLTSAGKHVGPSNSAGGGELWRGPRIGTKAKQDRRSRIRFVVANGERGELPQVLTVLGHRREDRC